MSSNTEVLSNWSTLIENFQYSPQRFYEQVAEAVERKQMPNAKIGKTKFKEGNFLSAYRQYLMVNCGKEDFYFAICGGQFGTGFFVSYWQLQRPDGCLVQLFSGFPLLSSVARALAKPWTYYRADTIAMFNTATHSAIMEVVDSMTSAAQGVRALADNERRPELKGTHPMNSAAQGSRAPSGAEPKPELKKYFENT
ncbi:MAG: hypothetical protein ABL984_11995 [Pyrinomonadaceae bacterium]